MIQTSRCRRAALLLGSVALGVSAPPIATADANTLRPDGEPGAFSVIGAPSAASALDDPVSEPTAVPATDYIYGSTAGRVSEVTLGTTDLGGQPPASSRAWFYANTGAGSTLRAEVVSRGRTLSALSVPSGRGFAWRPITFTPASQADVDDLRLRFTAVGGPDTNVHAAYATVTAAAGDGGHVAVVGPTLNVRPADQVTGTSGATLVAARNEFESFQVVVGAGSTRLTQVDVALAKPLTGTGGTIPAANVSIYRAGDHTTRFASDAQGGTGVWRDPLVPVVDPLLGQRRNAFPVDVPAAANVVAWVDVLVPQGAAPGRYEGALRVTASGTVRTVPVSLTVLQHTLPSTSSLRSAFRINWNTPCTALYGASSCSWDSEAGWRANRLIAVSALNNRITLANTSFQPPAGTLNQQRFSRFLRPLIEGTADEGSLPKPLLPGARLTSVEVGGTDDVLRAWRAQAEAGGFADRAYAYPCDEPESRGPQEWEKCRTGAEQARRLWPKLPVLITANIDAVRDQPGLLAQTDILTVLVQHMTKDPRTGVPGNQRGKYDSWVDEPVEPRNGVWMYASCVSHGCGGPLSNGVPDYVVDQPGSEARAMGWLAHRHRASGELYWEVDYRMATAWDDQWAFTGNGDGTLFYPGTPARIGGTDAIPIESIRLKRIRDGYEDHEYLSFLRRHQRGALADELTDALFPQGSTTSPTDATVREVRLRLVRAVAELTGGPVPVGS